MVWGQVNLRNVYKGNNPLHEAIQKSVLTCEIVYWTGFARYENAHGHIWAVLGLCEHASRTHSACSRITVGCKLNEFLTTR
jgi:hypothetical protein